MSFSNDDLSNYNRADSPWFQVSLNGKVDIGSEQGNSSNKIGLSKEGMITLIATWLKEAHISKEDKEKIKELL
ncbi:hypothetical protein J45TS6_48440 [Paenibacillus sp. J45TS6]|uniref:hypothetical protein n=1 Tax=Paenibacillus sp. J45TS6 TaxID=2807196 RepID=UPI001B23D509|nr:hypothetical protein [Paenibacillus sp. J45TS6]GIP46385.1 hypothetical protein J45TS6_48440 [Paenibacillus sp. J45TS6]